MIQKIPIAVSPNTKLMMAYIVNPIIDSPVANPSKPSVKFTALEKPTCQKTMKITYANDSGIDIPKWNMYARRKIHQMKHIT